MKKIKMDNPANINAIGGVIAALVLFIFTQWAGKVQKRQSDADRNEIIAKSDIIARLSTETANSVTGKDSYCYVKIVIPVNSDKAYVYLIHSGKYVVRNIKISLINTDEEAKKKWDEPVSYEDKYAKKYHKKEYPYIATIPVLIPNQHLRLKDFDIIQRDQKSFGNVQ